MMGSGIVWF